MAIVRGFPNSVIEYTKTMAVKHDDALIGKEIGHCRIERKVGAGGMGAVYLAHHTGLNKPVAIKVLPAELASNGEFIGRFQREARLAARLEHPNVVQVYDVGEEHGVHYITMQYIEGRSLDLILKEKKKFAVGEAVAVAKRVAVALAAAHKLGVVHRDIKPANILLSKDGLIKVADFGLAKDTDSNRTLSGTGQIVGTPYYMSPEQAQGLTVDARSDLYSLGATLYHMITGRKPFEAATPISIVLKHVNEEPVPPRQIDPTIPENVCLVIARLMKKKPDERPASAEALVRELDALKASPASTVQSPPPAKSRRRAAMIALPIAGILVVGIILGLVLGKPSSAGPTEGKGDSKKPEIVQASTPQPPKATEPPKPIPKPPDPPPPKPEEPRQRILGKIKDTQEKRLTEELIGRTDELLKAMQKKDLKTVRGMLDKLAYGDLPDAQLAEMFSRLLAEKVEIEKWEFDDVQVHLKGLVGRTTAVCQMSYSLKIPKGEVKVSDQPIHWVHKPDGWYVTRPPRTADK
jgi:serine/threonine protein kinase